MAPVLTLTQYLLGVYQQQLEHAAPMHVLPCRGADDVVSKKLSRINLLVSATQGPCAAVALCHVGTLLTVVLLVCRQKYLSGSERLWQPDAR